MPEGEARWIMGLSGVEEGNQVGGWEEWLGGNHGKGGLGRKDGLSGKCRESEINGINDGLVSREGDQLDKNWLGEEWAGLSG